MASLALPVVGIIFLTAGAIMGLIGIASTDWLVFRGCRYGLWQTCCSSGCNDIDNVKGWQNAIRIMMVLADAFLFLSIFLILLYLFKDSCRRSYGFKLICSSSLALSTLWFLVLVMAYATKEYSSGLLGIVPDLRLGWSFYVGLVGAFLAPIGTFLICTFWRKEEDEVNGKLGSTYL